MEWNQPRNLYQYKFTVNISYSLTFTVQKYIRDGLHSILQNVQGRLYLEKEIQTIHYKDLY